MTRMTTDIHYSLTFSSSDGAQTDTHRRGTCFITIYNSSCGKVMFSQASVILSTGGGVHPQADTPLGTHPLDRHLPPGQTPTPPPPLGRHPTLRRPLRRTVRILLECILVIQIEIEHHVFMDDKAFWPSHRLCDLTADDMNGQRARRVTAPIKRDPHHNRQNQ